MWRRIRVALMLAFALGAAASAQQLDICGCKNSPASLGSFDSLNAATYPPGTISAFRSLQIPLPADGVLVFNSVNLQPRPTDSSFLTVSFIKNAANTAVTLLVSGNVTLAANTTLTVGGDDGLGATTDKLGTGGNGGPGGNRGGDGAYQLVNFASIGGAGLGPSGGAGGTGAHNTGVVAGYSGAGNFVSATDLLPLVGGSGGGGGGSTAATPGCAGGGGGGGGGALLLASNGTITITGEINADGGNYGAASNGGCASYGAGGSGGAIRLLANTIAGTTGHVYARGGSMPQGGRAGAGAIRAEALNNTMNVSATDPLAARTPGPGAIANIVNPSVSITAVAGQAIAATPQGSYGGVDLILPVAGPTSVDFSTSGVPTGTTVNVIVKPRVGGLPVTNTIALNNCDGNGNCLATTSFSLAAGSYFVEARATFQTP